MKHTILALLLIALSLGVHAQTEKGKILVGATCGGLNFASDTLNKSFSFSVNPRVGYFVADNLALGVDLGISLSRFVVPSQYSSSNFSLAPSLFSRYYIGISDRFKVPVELKAGYSRNWSKSSLSSGSRGVFQASLLGGASYFLAENASLDLMLGYGIAVFENFNNPTTGSDGSLAGSFGFSLYLD